MDYRTPTLFDGAVGARFAPDAHSKLDSTVKLGEFSPLKIIITGGIVECYKPQFPFLIGKARDIDERNKKTDRKPEYEQRSASRARNKIRRLVQSNFDRGDKFITLTFRDTPDFDIRSLGVCNQIFRRFLKKLKYRYPQAKYIGVPEFQDKKGRGAVHYHLICSIPFVDSESLASLWGFGFVRINQIRRSSKVGVYLSKYITKQGYLARFRGYKKYVRSAGLSEPITVYGASAIKFYDELYKAHLDKIVHQNIYDTKYNGRVFFTEFNFYREEVSNNESIFRASG